MQNARELLLSGLSNAVRRVIAKDYKPYSIEKDELWLFLRPTADRCFAVRFELCANWEDQEIKLRIQIDSRSDSEKIVTHFNHHADDLATLIYQTIRKIEGSGK
jgi:hypothetical protein